MKTDSDNNQSIKGNAGELHQQSNEKRPSLTTQQGLKISDNQNSLTHTTRGATMLEDFILREKITHFDHERIPERIVHARGTAAHGFFELTNSLEEYTTAKILTEVGKKTDVFARFSTVAGGAGSVDTPRDVRGFAVKFYTDEGNWDLVGNNIPVFFIQDVIKFPDLIHAVKMEPDRGFPQAASAHDTFWDFISLMPESLHTVIWAMSDRAIPRSLRMMEGFGIHSFRLVNSHGKSTFVKFHWRPVLGIQSTTWNEAVKIAGADPDYHRRDFFEAIQAGEYPEWELAVQLFNAEEANAFPFDHLDPTKIIPEELVPLKTIGKMTLNRWPDNFFAETEQVAFCPSHIVPGIDFSNDPLLQGRLHSYLDTQLKRLGGPNFSQIPINAPKCPFHNLQRDGHMQMMQPKGRTSYEPQSLEDKPRENIEQGFKSFEERADDGVKGRKRPESFGDHYSQARQFYKSQLDIEKSHIVNAFSFELSKVGTEKVRLRVLSHLRLIDHTLAEKVAQNLGVDDLPEAADPFMPVKELPESPAIQMIGKMKHTLQGRLVGILAADGSSRLALEAYLERLKQEGAMVKIVSPKLSITLDDGSDIDADGIISGLPSVFFDAVVSILNEEESKKLTDSKEALDFFSDAYYHLKAIAYCQNSKKIIAKLKLKEDAGLIGIDKTEDFISQAKTRQWQRESAN